MNEHTSRAGNGLLLVYAGCAFLFCVLASLRHGFGVAVPALLLRGAFAAATAALAAVLLFLIFSPRHSRLNHTVFLVSQVIGFLWWLAVLLVAV